MIDTLRTVLTEHSAWVAGLLVVVAVLDTGLAKRPRRVWLFAPAAVLQLLAAPGWLVILAALGGVVLLLPALRRPLLSAPILGVMNKLGFLPRISDTERTAIEAGTVWVDGDLFSGRPDWRRLLSQPWPELTPREQAFLDGPVEEACRLCPDWEVQELRDLPPAVWDHLKQERFFGMIVPEEHGGLGFSATAQSAVIGKLASRSQTLAITVMVPNSLGPAELLLHHGTDEQRAHYLPRLASGEEIPCFALTEPGAGSDAGSIQSEGVVFRGEDGQPHLRLSWDKRYITLAAISTVIGLAFRLRDPEGLLGGPEDRGITCALVPSDTPGVELGRRHDPLGVPFYNCPTQGHDVVVPLTAVIGGVDGVGRGWQMLMEALAAGRGISLPAAGAGGAKLVARVASAHAAVRKQFGLPIGRFEGIEEPLARIGGFAWLLEAMRRYTTGGIDQGAKPAVVTAMAKLHATELFRRVANDGMDVLGGNGISRGPRNLLGPGYTGAPIMITVEGANILTRTLMIFGQGAIRCHPYAYAEVQAAAARDTVAFDQAFWGHLGHVARNACRTLLMTLSRGWLASSPVGGPVASHVRKLSWASASFALFADVAMASLGGDLKRREKLTGRFADVFGWLYLCNAGLRRFEAEGRKKEDLPYLEWSLQHGLARIQEAFDGIFRNLHVPVVGWLIRPVLVGWSRMNPIATEPSDELGGRVARALQVPDEARDAVTSGLYLPTDEDEALARLEHAHRLCHEADQVVRRLRQAVKRKRLKKAAPAELVSTGVESGIITEDEAALVARAEEARAEAIRVDSFTLEEYARFAAVETERPAGVVGAS
ncbi:MAG: acyl-CoA dehydrogenase [Acidobacteriota bacterium]